MRIADIVNINYFFLQDVPNATVASPGVGLPYKVSISVNNASIFSETLYGDETGNVTLYDIPALLEPYITQGSKNLVTINSYAFYVFYSREELREFATHNKGRFETWLEENWLSPDNEFTVAFNQTVNIWLMSSITKVVAMQMNVIYLDGNRTKKYTRYANVSLTGLSPYCITTSLASLSSLVPGEIMGAVISTTTKKFVIKRMIGAENVTLKYDNRFGLTEYVALQGELKEKPQYEFTTALFFSRTQNVNISEKRISEFSTSAISLNTLNRLKDAIKAENIQMIRGDRAYDIVFDTADIAFSDSKKDLQGVTFSFHRAVNNRMDVEVADTGMAARIFSDEFNDSFN